MDLLLCFIAVCALLDLCLNSRRYLSHGRLPSHLILRSVEKAIAGAWREGTLGPLRIEKRHGELFVVGYGQRHRVRTREDGQRLIARIDRQVSAALRRRAAAC